MRRESHVRFWEGRGVKLPSATRLVIALESRRDGERVLAALDKRLAEHGLTLHPTKTRQVDFRPKAGGHGSSNRFDFLGFICLRGKSRKECWLVRQFTARERLARAVKPVWNWCKEHPYMQLGDQCRHLAGVILGTAPTAAKRAMANGSPVSGAQWPEDG